MQRDKYYVTTPIYYVNDRPHIGHAYTTVLADVLARYHRLLDVPTWFLTGTDEHGQKVQRAAEKAGISPQAHVDAQVAAFQELWKKLEITHDDFIRTTEPRHVRVVQQWLQTLYDAGEIYRDEYNGWYCVPDERFFAEEELVDGKCPECGREVEQITEANYFFRMSRYQEWLVRHIEENPRFIQPDFRRNETLGFLRKPLKDLCISRPKSRLAWGIELPFDTDFVTYVWFDALVNYVSAIGHLTDDEKFSKWWPVSCHLIGKDILVTHTVYWPTFMKAMGVPMPECIFAHGWWLSGETKMGKSLGNVVNPMAMIDRCGVDAFRYFLLAAMSPGQDASFTEEAFVARYNSDLANDLGNLVSRVLNLMVKNCDGAIPPVPGSALDGEDERELWALTQAASDGLEPALKSMALDKEIAEVIAAVRAANRYMERRKPWLQAKEMDKEPLHVTLYTVAEVLRVVAGLLHPVMPERMTALRVSLGLPSDPPHVPDLKKFGLLKPGTPVTKPDALFPRIVIEEKPVEEAVSKPPPSPPPPTKAETPSAEPVVGVIDYEDFAKVKLRTAKVMAAERVPNTAKLLKLEVMMGSERRQIVAGIAMHYDPDKLIGKTVVVVANLKPVVLRGVESQGMLLAASKGETLRLITVEGELSSGAEVK